MKTPHNIQPSIDDEISIADMINFFKSHKKVILILAIIGAILGHIFANFTEPVYKGSVLMSPAKVSGVFVMTPKNILTRLTKNSFYSKETFLICNPYFYKNKDKDKDINYNISSLVKASLTKDEELIELQMEDKNKIVIENCLKSVIDDIHSNQDIITKLLFESKNNELKFAEERLKNTEEFRNKLNDNLIEELKTNSKDSVKDLAYAFMTLLNSQNIKETMAEINKLKIDIYINSTKADKALPISIEKKSLSPKLSILLGLFLGLCAGTLIALIKQIKI